MVNVPSILASCTLTTSATNTDTNAVIPSAAALPSTAYAWVLPLANTFI